jgi:site-specific recombinase XerD
MDLQQLGIILTGFSDHLQSLGYAPMTVQDYIRSANHFCRWLKIRRYSTADINREIIHSFLEKHLRHCHCPRPASRHSVTNGSALWRLLELLQAHGISQRKSTASTPKARIIGRFNSYLLDVCGVAETTCRNRRRTALELLNWRFGNRPLRLQKLSGIDLLGFVAFRARTLSPISVRALSDSLRSFLRFLQFEGHCPKDLDLVVPKLHACNLAKLPTVIDEAKLRQFLGSYDRSTSIGRRNYAMALCMTDLGLRVSEVAQLSLDDLDWHHNTLTLPKTKQRREHKLPLPNRLARAIAGYLRQGRPTSNRREVFLRHRTPVGRPLQTVGIRWAIRQGYDRVGIQATGTHLLRRTFATQLHRRGANLKLIADFLGHKDIETAAVYARVNLKQLRMLALSWPKGSQ